MRLRQGGASPGQRTVRQFLQPPPGEMRVLGPPAEPSAQPDPRPDRGGTRGLAGEIDPGQNPLGEPAGRGEPAQSTEFAEDLLPGVHPVLARGAVLQMPAGGRGLSVDTSFSGVEQALDRIIVQMSAVAGSVRIHLRPVPASARRGVSVLAGSPGSGVILARAPRVSVDSPGVRPEPAGSFVSMRIESCLRRAEA